MTAALPSWLVKMMTGIEWADFTVNGWGGCTAIPAVSGALSACSICYARTYAGNRLDITWGAGEPRRRFKTAADKARRINRIAKRLGVRFSAFGMSLADWLDPEVDASWRAAFIELVEECDQLDWLLLTHRPHLIAKLAPESWKAGPPAHVWPGVTVEHRLHAFRWQQLLDAWGGCGRCWPSIEPMASSMAGIDFSAACCIIMGGATNTSDPRWTPRREWALELIQRYPEKSFLKQWGVFAADGEYVGNKKTTGRELDGRKYEFLPWALHRDAEAGAHVDASKV